jgi:hypothetical protein
LLCWVMGNQNGRPKIKILRASVKLSSEESSPRRGKKDKDKDKDKDKEKDKDKDNDKEKEREKEEKEKKDKRKVDTDSDYDEDEEDEDHHDELGDEQEFIPCNNHGDNDIAVSLIMTF